VHNRASRQQIPLVLGHNQEGLLLCSQEPPHRLKWPATPARTKPQPLSAVGCAFSYKRTILMLKRQDAELLGVSPARVSQLIRDGYHKRSPYG
jgi:hypothetical protein